MTTDLTLRELAARWRCSVFTIRRMIEARELEGVLTISRNHRLVPLSSVEAYEKKHTATTKRKAA